MRRKEQTRIGIMGGTFDPIHYGHLVTAEGARGEFDLDQVLFVPSGQPPHKQHQQVTDAKHRYLMTVLATLTNPSFSVSRVDIDREGTSYTIETLNILRQQYGDDAKLFFITGTDAMAEIISWKEPTRLLEMAEFIGAARPGYSFDHGESGGFFASNEKRMHTLQIPAMAISSTDIRERVKCGKSIRYLVPEAVDHYIRKNALYEVRSN